MCSNKPPDLLISSKSVIRSHMRVLSDELRVSLYIAMSKI